MNTFKNTFIDKKKSILIPLLQRDYVQGGRPDIIKPLLDHAIEALTTLRKLELNYIYGYDENDDASLYVAIDGQQRLTTLWLLHLYIYSLTGISYPVKLQFQSRQSAQAFVDNLMKELPTLLPGKKGEIADVITDAQWFRTFWNEDPTVRNMLQALRIIDDKNIPTEMSQLKMDNIQFSFLNMKEKGLDDDVYIKMNGRGRPLSYFENVKSWMDEQVKTIKNEQTTMEWRSSMDGKWAGMFWQERNKGQQHPEEIDDEQLRFLYSALLLFWVKNRDKLKINLSLVTDNYLFTSLCDFMDVEEKSAKENPDVLANAVFWILKEGKKMIPVFWLDKLALFNESVFSFIKESLDRLCDLAHQIRGLEFLFPDYEVSEQTSLLYHLAFAEEASYNKTLPVLYAILKSPYKQQGHLFHWLRVIRNLVVNSSIDLKDMVDVLGSIDYLEANSSRDEFNLYSLLLKDGISKQIRGFNQSQVKEEVTKAAFMASGFDCTLEAKEASLTRNSLAESMISLENLPQFQGQIRFMFKILGEPTESVEYAKQFERVGKVMAESITWNKGEIRTAYPDSLFRRALITYRPHCFGKSYGNYKWQNIYGNQWKEYLVSTGKLSYNDVEYEQTDALKCLILDVCQTLEGKQITKESICEAIANRVSIFSDPNQLDCYWKHFVRHPGVWSYMEYKLTNDWITGNDINLIRSINIGPRMNLRTLSLFLDICDTGQLSLKKYYNTWEGPYKSEYDDDYKTSCFRFEKLLEDGNHLLIDVFHTFKKEEDYHIQVFVKKPDNLTNEEFAAKRAQFYSANKISGFKYAKTRNGEARTTRFESGTLTRNETISLLKELLRRDWKIGLT